jgi:hypothetical protein
VFVIRQSGKQVSPRKNVTAMQQISVKRYASEVQIISP